MTHKGPRTEAEKKREASCKRRKIMKDWQEGKHLGENRWIRKDHPWRQKYKKERER